MTNRPSLRALARRLRCSHSSLSAQIHAGLFTTGVAIGAHGRVIVTDIDCAIRAWRGLPTARANEAIVLTDHALDCQVTARQLFEERDALSLLVTALVSAALGDAVSGPLDDRQVAVLRTRIAAQLRAVAELHGADADDISRAEADLASTLVLLAEEGEDEDEDTPIANRKVGIDISGDS